MDTPWGPLAGLDPDNRDLALQILQSDKHQLLEGLVVENTFDQLVLPLATVTPRRLVPLDVATVVAQSDGDGRRLFFVWSQNPGAVIGLRRYLMALSRLGDVYLVTYSGTTFTAQHRPQGLKSSDIEPLHDLLRRLTGNSPSISEVDLTVRDRDRQMTAFWGYLNTTYPGRELWNKVVLFRLLINHGIQPFFSSVWNLDRICLFDDQLWMFEVKHKFPFVSNQRLVFGLNVGELSLMNDLDKVSVRILHALIVKPVWSKDVGSMYLHSDLTMRERAAVIGFVMNRDRINQLASSRSGSSPSHTVLTGRGRLSYKTIPAEDFRFLGAFSDGAQPLSANLASLLDGGTLPAVTDSLLRRLRVQMPATEP